jgi:hypothetical protein
MDEIFNLHYKDITTDLLMSFFATINDKPSKYQFNQKIKLDKALLEKYNSFILKCKNNSELIDKETTIGRYIVNLFIFELPLLEEDKKNYKLDNLLCSLIDYREMAFNKKALNDIYKELSKLFIEEKISAFVMTEFIDRITWLGFNNCFFINAVLDNSTIQPSTKVATFRDNTLKNNKDIMDSNDAIRFLDEIEKPVLDFAVDELNKSNASGKHIYASGFSGELSNNFKNNSLFRGVTPIPDNPSGYTISTSNLMDGVKKNDTDILTAMNVAVSGSAGRAKDTAMGGYKTKIFNACFSSLVLDEPNSDCGSKIYYKTTLTESNYNEYKFRYIAEGSKLIELTDDSYKSYIGKQINLRTPLYCHSKSICNKCAGNFYYKMKIKNIGLLVSNISATLMYASMKSFHNLSVKSKKYDIQKFISEA